jgi:hypothetical protein
MKRGMFFGVIGLAGMLATSAHGARTYFIDQVVNYPTPCTQPNLFDDTWSLKSRMDAASWTGSKYTDGAAWARDFRESCSTQFGTSGLDNIYGDASSFTVFSGHGNPAKLYFGVAQNTCTINIDNQVRLGAMNGASAAVAMYLSCSTLSKNSSGTPLHGGLEWVRQQLGFHDITGDQTAAYGSFFDDTQNKNNSQAWLDRLWDQPAIAISYANGNNSCWDISNSARLKMNNFTSSRGGGPSCGGGQPLYQWCSMWAN